MEVEDDNDVTLICGGTVFQANKQQLCGKSAYFQALFECGMKEAISNEIHLNDIDDQALAAILEHVATSELSNLPSNQCFLTNMLSATHMLLMTDLFEHCGAHFHTVLNPGNMHDIWDTAVLYGNKALLKAVMDFIAENFDAIHGNIVSRLSYDELMLVLTSDKLKASPADMIIDFILTWVNLDSRQRTSVAPSLFQATDISSLTGDYLDTVLNKDSLLRSKLVADSLLEAYTCSRFRVVFFTTDHLYLFSIRDRKWHTAPFPKFYQHFWNGCWVSNVFYLFTGSKREDHSIINAVVFNCKDNSSTKIPLSRMENFLDHTAVLNGLVYNLDIKEREESDDQFVHENSLFVFDPSTQKLSLVSKSETVYRPSSLIAWDNKVILFDKRAKRVGFFKYYDVAEKSYSSLVYPEVEDERYEERGVTCNNDLYLVRYARIIEGLFWTHDEPRPEQTLQMLETKGCVEYRTLPTGVKCMVFSRKKTLYKYVPAEAAWEKSETSDGPEEILTILNVPQGPYYRVPKIFVVGTDCWLYSLDPTTLEWQKLSELRSIHLRDFRHLLMMAGC